MPIHCGSMHKRELRPWVQRKLHLLRQVAPPVLQELQRRQVSCKTGQDCRIGPVHRRVAGISPISEHLLDQVQAPLVVHVGEHRVQDVVSWEDEKAQRRSAPALAGAELLAVEARVDLGRWVHKVPIEALPAAEGPYLLHIPRSDGPEQVLLRLAQLLPEEDLHLRPGPVLGHEAAVLGVVEVHDAPLIQGVLIHRKRLLNNLLCLHDGRVLAVAVRWKQGQLLLRP
mmetsp:Transcript_41676/g.120752  ORF Transcript_41676/g.120752 Transcript_41676/m.120752 type:complete len:227 (+) Transcript_41676:551-1231(+)